MTLGKLGCVGKPVALIRAAWIPALAYSLTATKSGREDYGVYDGSKAIVGETDKAHCFVGQGDGETTHTVDTIGGPVYSGGGGDSRGKERDGVSSPPWTSARGTTVRREAPVRVNTTFTGEWRPRVRWWVLKAYREVMPKEDRSAVHDEARESVRGPQRS